MNGPILFCVLALFCLNGCYLSNHYINVGKLTVEVVGEDGMAIKGVKISIGSYIGADNRKVNSVDGYTNDNGKFTATLSGTNEYSVTANKNSYYGSWLAYKFKESKLKRWKPWNQEVRLVLYKIGNRVPMYAHNTEYSKIEIPVIGKKIGFDLVTFDWLSPYGKGTHPDLIFKLDKKYTDSNNFSSKLTISFLNTYDGIQLVKQDPSIGSGLKLSRFAPKGGYQREITQFIQKIPNTPLKTSFKGDSNYFFRVRSEVKNGKLLRAMYGKIYGDIVFEPRGTKSASILFKYFLNPDYTTTMEFEPKLNLFKGLSNLEKNGLN